MENRFSKPEFGSRLEKLRKARGLSQMDMTEVEGIEGIYGKDPQKIWNYEKGVNSPKLETIFALCKFFGVSSDYMLGLTREMLPGAESIEEATGLTQASIAALHRMKQEGGDEIVCIMNQLLSMIGFYWAMSDIGNAKRINERMDVSLSGERPVFAKLMLDMENMSQNSMKSVVVDGKFARDAYIHRAVETIQSLFKEIVKSTAQEEGK